VVGPYCDARQGNASLRTTDGPAERTEEARLLEANGLARAIGLDIAGEKIVPLKSIRPASFLGKGQVAELAALIAEREASLVVMDCALSAVQQRNLEKSFAAKVVDRNGLILEIFGQRARTREGSLQVELAHLAYQKSRLVRSWTHLERQRGGFGFLGGPGETQIEADRRLIEERMIRLERELERVKRTRGLHRKSRRAVPYPVVALVGYTNSGKSTLFNRLTRATVVAEDALFATLDPTLRELSLPHGGKVILSDTVGFIADLPVMLIKAFRATLEEVVDADLLLHVRDIANDDSEAQQGDVTAILNELGVGQTNGRRLLEVWNKSDLLDEAAIRIVHNRANCCAGEGAVVISAATGQGVEELLGVIENQLAKNKLNYEICIEPANGAGLNWLHENTEIIKKIPKGDGLHLQIRIAPERANSFLRRFSASTMRRV